MSTDAKTEVGSYFVSNYPPFSQWRTELTPQILAGALDDLASTPAYARAAEALGEKLKLEDGTNLAVDVIEETIASYDARPPHDQELLGVAS